MTQALLSDLELLTTCIADEASGEPFEGKLAVGRVVRNRRNLHYDSDGTVAGTVLAKFQFSGFWFSMVEGHYTRTVWNADEAWAQAKVLRDEFFNQPIWSQCELAARMTLHNSQFTGGPQFQRLTEHTVLYYNPRVVAEPPEWATPDKLDAVIFRHNFYHA